MSNTSSPAGETAAPANRVIWPLKALAYSLLQVALLLVVCIVPLTSVVLGAWWTKAPFALFAAVLLVVLVRTGSCFARVYRFWRMPQNHAFLERARAIVQAQSLGRPPDVVVDRDLLRGPYYSPMRHQVGVPLQLQVLGDKALRATLRHEVEHAHQCVRHMMQRPRVANHFVPAVVEAMVEEQALGPLERIMMLSECEADLAGVREVGETADWHLVWFDEVCQALGWGHVDLACVAEGRARQAYVREMLARDEKSPQA